MKLAGIDLGTNSALLLVAQAEGERVVPLLEEEREVRIGEGLNEMGRLNSNAMERALRALSEFKEKAQGLGAGRISLAGTSALREAENGEEFVGLLRERLKMELSILSPQEEAELSFRGGLYGLERYGPQVLMADIGGGSTELIMGDGERIKGWQSLPLGAVRLSEGFVHSDPISQDDLHRLKEEICREFQGMDLAISKREMLVGVGGTITTLAAMDMAMADYDPVRVHGYGLRISPVSALFGRLKASTLPQRRKMKGLSPRRAEIILAGTAICLHLMEITSQREILVSSRGLRWGLVLREVSNS